MSRIVTVFCWLTLVIGTIKGISTSEKRKVCVIGAGPNGLFSVKQLADNLDVLEPIVFEQYSDVGGSWIYTDDGDVGEHGLPVQSGIYESLRTNLPKELMACPEFEFKGENRSCVRHETVLEYLRNYTDHFDLRQFIKVNTLVEKIIPLSIKNDWRKTNWLVRARNLNTNVSFETTCDFVIVCTGHLHKPLVPTIPGIETFTGHILHSHSYRRPEEFSSQTVVILGASYSGRDIAIDISNHTQTVYLSHRHEKLNIPDMPKNVIEVPGVIAAEGRKLILQNGSAIEADSFIFCTGYKNDFPFLDASSGINVYDKYLYPLYKQIINIEYPSMGFVAFPENVRYFCPKAHMQAKYYVALIRSNFELPTRGEMMKDAEFMLPGNPQIDKFEWQWNYLAELAKNAGSEPLDDFYKRGFELWKSHSLHNRRYAKEYDLRKLDDGSLIVVKSNAE